MTIGIRLISPLALYRKLERESYRAFHAKSLLHKADHFFNFCVTASSMRDYTLEHRNLTTKAQKTPHYAAWAKIPALVAAAEIANSSKHFTLRSPGSGVPRIVKTKTVRTKSAEFVDLYMNSAGEIKTMKSVRTAISITLSDGQVLELYGFTSEIMNYWKNYLFSLGLKVRRQSFAQLSGK